jgi:hypothetical protein
MPARMFSVEGMMGLRSWRYAEGTAIFRAVAAAISSIADGVPSALKPRRTRISPYPAAATARANRISETAFQGFMSTSSVPCHRRPPERRQVPAEVLRILARRGPGRRREENAGARLELCSCLRPEPIDCASQRLRFTVERRERKRARLHRLRKNSARVP